MECKLHGGDDVSVYISSFQDALSLGWIHFSLILPADLVKNQNTYSRGLG